MGVAATVFKLVPNVEAAGGFIRDAWKRLHRVPGGKRMFSELIGRAAPYTGTIGAKVVELGPGHAKVVLADRRAVRNHLSCVHAIALCNLAELTGNVALAYSMPVDARFIVAGLSIEYVKKARGTITGTCEIAPIETNARHEYDVPVTMKNPAGEVVATATLRTLVGPRR